MSSCVKCGEVFHCVMVDGENGKPCWCTAIATIPAGVLAEAGADGSACFCPTCLYQIAEQASISTGDIARR